MANPDYDIYEYVGILSYVKDLFDELVEKKGHSVYDLNEVKQMAVEVTRLKRLATGFRRITQSPGQYKMDILPKASQNAADQKC